ncbi:hypothetical protein MCUN1_002695 [Malassezia cuniculi]|uniref:DUF221-domain-containing protein n=1 Tax=Malassezia cuniculi TaxID=948313 RepID=A0AAF0EZY2_9BASI|nr:hypothetical protein MCUN1_002695 [Malassezia cuniculi]
MDIWWSDMRNDTLPELPGRPSDDMYEGPWLQQQIIFSLVLGLFFVMIFLFRARRHSDHIDRLGLGNQYSLLSWAFKTIRFPDVAVLQTIGLDAATGLLFLKMGFIYMLCTSFWAVFVLMPVNYYQNGWIDGVSKGESMGYTDELSIMHNIKLPAAPLPYIPVPKVITRKALYENTQLTSVYFCSLLALYLFWRTYGVFIRFRQGHADQEMLTQRARTVEVRSLPAHLTDADALAAYFGTMNLEVETAVVLKETTALDHLLVRRLAALERLEKTWAAWAVEPLENLCPDSIAAETRAIVTRPHPGGAPLVGTNVQSPRGRPQLRVSLNPFVPTVDAIDYYSFEFAELDREVQRMRESSFATGHAAFVTFADAVSAQIASQVVHYPHPGHCETLPAAEPRDILWQNEEPAIWDRRFRNSIVFVIMTLFLLFYGTIISFLATFLNLEAIMRMLPWLSDMLSDSPRVRALVQNNLPAVIIPTFNGILPIALEASAYFQRFRSRSSVDYSVMKKYHLYLLFSVVFVSLVMSILWDLKATAEYPMRLIDRFAQSLPRARHFSLSYVVFQAFAMQPFQLIQLPRIIYNAYTRLSGVRSPRQKAADRLPSRQSLSDFYPQALLVFTLCMLYSIVSPLILTFGAIYFGFAYIVAKYQMLNVIDKPYEAHGHAWPLVMNRCTWALFVFQVFQFSLFSVRKQVFSSLMVVPLIAFTIWFHMHLKRTFTPLSTYLSLYDIYAAEDDQQDAAAEHATVAESTSIAPTLLHNMREPPLAINNPGVLDSSRSSYGQPAIVGRLPELWLPE